MGTIREKYKEMGRQPLPREYRNEIVSKICEGCGGKGEKKNQKEEEVGRKAVGR